MRKLVIIGSGISGFTAAIYAARANMKPLVISGLPLSGSGGVLGGQLTQTTEVENFPGFPEGVMGPELMEKAQKQAERFGAEVIQDHVKSIDLSAAPFALETENGLKEQAQAIIIATGASAKYLGLESEKRLAGRGVSACATCDGFFFRGKTIFVVGGGDTAMEEANFLARFGESVTLLHRRPEFRASKVMIERTLQNPKIRLKTPYTVDEVLGQDKVIGLKLRHIETGAIEEVKADGLFLAIGHRPNTAFLGSQADMDPVGYLQVDRHQACLKDGKALPGIFASGDVCDAHYRQAITAAGTGCAAALEAIRYLEAKGIA
jgi:thioredoxin reductase (NADPH)